MERNFSPRRKKVPCALNIYKYIKGNTNIHNHKGSHELTVTKFLFKNAGSDLIPFGTMQLLRFEKHAHGNMMH